MSKSQSGRNEEDFCWTSSRKRKDGIKVEKAERQLNKDKGFLSGSLLSE